MEIKDLEKHCIKQLNLNPVGSRLHYEHLLTLNLIESFKTYDKKLKAYHDLCEELIEKHLKNTEFEKQYKDRLKESS